VALILSHSDVERIVAELDGEVLEDLIRRVELGHREMAGGQVRQHSRIYLRYPEDGMRRPPGLFSMSALLPRAGVMGTRLLALGGAGGDGLLILFSQAEKKCLAIIDDSTLHEYRTGTPAALAARYLARPRPQVAGCIGSSGIGRGTLTMLCHALPSVAEIKVFSPNEAHRTAFAAELCQRLRREVRPVGSAEAAAEGVDLLVTATDADRPVVADGAISQGVHISAMARNEVDMPTLRRSLVVTASRQMDRELDPPLRDPIPDELIHCELTELVAGTAQGRSSERQITVFLGGGGPLATWDVAAAQAFYEAGKKLRLGTTVEIAE